MEVWQRALASALSTLPSQGAQAGALLHAAHKYSPAAPASPMAIHGAHLATRSLNCASFSSPAGGGRSSGHSGHSPSISGWRAVPKQEGTLVSATTKSANKAGLRGEEVKGLGAGINVEHKNVQEHMRKPGHSLGTALDCMTHLHAVQIIVQGQWSAV